MSGRGTGRRALMVVDVQNDFCEGGSLAVAGGARVAAAVADLVARGKGDRGRYDHVVATQDWHVDPGDHWSETPDFRTSWPVHCRADSPGAQLHPAFVPAAGAVGAVFRKGEHAAAYSGFEGVDEHGVGPAQWLGERGVVEVDVVGIATDHCVRATALDAVRAGLATRVLLDLTAGVDPQTTRAALEELSAAGVELVGQPVLAG